jgi:flagellin
VTLSATASFTSAATASTLAGTVDTSITNVSAALAKLGTSSKSFERHLSFVGKLQDTLTAGVGNLVDADLAKESATLQALQTKQQLGVQALSIANQSPQTILSLFR